MSLDQAIDQALDRSPDRSLDQVVAVWRHHGRAAALVRELKYGRATGVVSELADGMAAVAPAADMVTWVPASPSRRRDRGFDQCELLARALARRLCRPVRPVLRRTDDEAQTSRDRSGRAAGPSMAARGRRLRSSPRVLLIDDVTTTGVTLRVAADVLRRRGAASVVALVATRASPLRAGTYDPALDTGGFYDRG